MSGFHACPDGSAVGSSVYTGATLQRAQCSTLATLLLGLGDDNVMSVWKDGKTERRIDGKTKRQDQFYYLDS